MLNITLRELVCGTEKEVITNKTRFRVHKCQNILELVSESECAAGLIIPTSSPQPRGKHLVQQPAIGQNVDGLVRRLHLHGAEKACPMLMHRLEGLCRRPRASKTPYQIGGLVGITPCTEDENYFAGLSLGQFEGNLNRRTGIQGGSYFSR